ncbi:cytochrome P450 [Amycolatopsis suaedae]|uniref:Cytochrome P450 n=1 Tax=Amycolatopsis suaedae TaxID=2510978 RepID=A0A4V2ELE9_9PSEU|nr:cytochrome P450 [Amycolatopsis suaedae]RZQ61325.1 cytochrome P450 [Amycolatopsis suaedae]
MTAGTTSEALTYPVSRLSPFDEPEVYGWLREQRPVCKVDMGGGGTAWLVTRHADVRAILTDPRVSSDRRHPNFPKTMPGQGGFAKFKPLLNGMDQPEHGRVRRALAAEFTSARADAAEPTVRALVDGAVDALLAAGSPADLVSHVSLAVPSLVICDLLGVPYADNEFFQVRSARLVDRTLDGPSRAAAIGELRDYLARLIETKQHTPSDDLISRQIERQRADGEVDVEHLISLAFGFLFGGHETTANLISLSVVALLSDPAQLDRLKADPALWPGAVDELLRYFTVVDSIASRVATERIELGGAVIEPGDGIVAVGLSANRDETVFADPHRFDIGRRAERHVAFGFGPHKCIGQHLAKLELRVVLETLFRRIPSLSLALPVGELEFKVNHTIYGLHALPVRWSA